MALLVASILLSAGDAQSCHAALVDGSLPACELFKADRVTLAGFVDCQQTSCDGRYDFGLAAGSPSRRACSWEPFKRQKLPERTHDPLRLWIASGKIFERLRNAEEERPLRPILQLGREITTISCFL